MKQKVLILESQKTYKKAAYHVLLGHGYDVEAIDGDNKEQIKNGLEWHPDIVVLGKIELFDWMISQLLLLTPQVSLVFMGNLEVFEKEALKSKGLSRAVVIKHRPFLSGELAAAIELALSPVTSKEPVELNLEDSTKRQVTGAYQEQLKQVSDLLSLIQQTSQNRALDSNKEPQKLIGIPKNVPIMPRPSFLPSLAGVVFNKST